MIINRLRIIIGCLFILAILPRPGSADSGIESIRGVALVIGNGAYSRTSQLSNPVNDAEDVAKVLADLGWEVLRYTDASLVTMRLAVRQFAARLAGQKAGFFYYAGHGLQVDGVNYLVPVDADIQLKSEAQDSSISVDFILRAMDEARVPLKIMVLDACRDNPFIATRSAGAARGLAVLGKAPSGTVIVYATAPNDVSFDGKGRNGVFTDAFLTNLRTPGLEFREVFDRTGAQVRATTGGSQNPWMNSSYYGKLYLVSPQEAEQFAATQLSALNQELGVLEKARAERAQALAVARTQAERDRIDLEVKRAAALEAAKREEVAALERAKTLVAARAAEELQNSAAASLRAAAAEAQLVLLRQQAEERRNTLGMSFQASDGLAVSHRLLVNNIMAIDDVRTRFGESLSARLKENEDAYNQRVKSIGLYQKDPWENDKEFQERKKEAIDLATRDFDREAAGLRADYSEASQRETLELEKALSRLESGVVDKIWDIPPASIKIDRRGFDADKKSWLFTVECADPQFKTTLDYTIQYKTTEELAQRYVALDNAWKANALEARATTALRKKAGSETWEAYVVSVSLVDLTANDQVLASRQVGGFPFIPPRPDTVPGKVVVEGLPAVGVLTIGSQSKDVMDAVNGSLEFLDVPSDERLPVSWSLASGMPASYKQDPLVLGEGETRALALKTGTLHVPYLPGGSRLRILGGKAVDLVPAQMVGDSASFDLLPGSYDLQVRGLVQYSGTAEIQPGRQTVLPGYNETVFPQLARQTDRVSRQIAAIKPRKLVSFASLGAGLAGSILSGIAYYQGASAMAAYDSAGTTAALLEARDSVNRWGLVFNISAVVTGLSLALAPSVWPWIPEHSLRATLDDLAYAALVLRP
jgi:uncharacterized caspase-like protein